MKDHLTPPMKIVLIDLYRSRGTATAGALYPGGQMRLIHAGLRRRGLLDEANRLTDDGFAAAKALSELADRDWTEVVK